MSQAVQQQTGGGLPDYIRRMFTPGVTNRPLVENVGAAMRVMSLKGKVFRLIEKGVEQIVQDPQGRPSPVFECVIIGANPILSRNYYAGRYQQGDDNPPTCWSVDNVKPDQTVQAKQSQVCATCPHNAWGSRQSENGSRGKACGEFRRLAVLPVWELPKLGVDPDVRPYLLRVPPGSLQSLKGFGELLERVQLPFNAVTCEIGFDPNTEFTLTFKPTEYVPEQFARAVIESAASDDVKRLLSMSENDLRPAGASTTEEAIASPTPAAPEQATTNAGTAAPVQQPAQETQQAAQTTSKPRTRRTTTAAAPATQQAPAPTQAAPATPPVSNIAGGGLQSLMAGLGVPTPAAQVPTPTPQPQETGPVINGTAEEVDEGDEGDEEVGEEPAQTMAAPGGLQSLVNAALQGR